MEEGKLNAKKCLMGTIDWLLDGENTLGKDDFTLKNLNVNWTGDGWQVSFRVDCKESVTPEEDTEDTRI